MNVAVMFFVGAISSLVYFGGLWWTVQRLVTSQCPRRIYIGSLLLRLACLLLIIGVAVQFGELLAIAAFFGGFLVARALIVRHVSGPHIQVPNHE